MYNAKLKKMRRTMNTRAAKKRLFNGRKHRPCAYCGKTLSMETATFDHVHALGTGGYDKTKNGALACRKCNSRKGRKTVEQFMKGKHALQATQRR